MKRIIALFLSIFLLVSIVGCKGKKQDINNSSKVNNSISSNINNTTDASSQNENTDENPLTNSSANDFTDNKDNSKIENTKKPDNTLTVNGNDKLSILFNSTTLSAVKTNDKELDELVKKLLKDILKNKETTKEKTLACYDYIVNKITLETPLIFFGEEKYASECDYYTVEYAKNILTSKKGGFEGYASALVVLLRAIGLEAYLVGGSVVNDGVKKPHAWCVVKIQDKDYIFDPLLEQADNKGKHFYFCKTYDQLKDLYVIDKSSIFAIKNFKNFIFATCDTVGHKWKEATCITAKTCTVCGLVEGEKSNHIWTGKSCDDLKVCSVCGEQSNEKLGHDFAAATCLSPKKCKRCGITEGTITDHSYTEKIFDATCTEEGRIYHICSICTASYYETIAIKGHTYDEWITTLKATTETDGEKKRTCKNCKNFETASISKLSKEETQIAILELINTERKNLNLAPLEYFTLGQSAADKRADEIITSFSHTRPNGSKFYTILGENSITYRATAESIIKDLTSPDEVIKQLMSLPDDKKNILGDYKNIILGYKNRNWVILFIDQ